MCRNARFYRLIRSGRSSEVERMRRSFCIHGASESTFARASAKRGVRAAVPHPHSWVHLSSLHLCVFDQICNNLVESRL